MTCSTPRVDPPTGRPYIRADPDGSAIEINERPLTGSAAFLVREEINGGVRW